MSNEKSNIGVKREGGITYVDVGKGYTKLTNELLLEFFSYGNGKYKLDDLEAAGLHSYDLPSEIPKNGKAYYLSKDGYTEDEQKQVLLFESYDFIEMPPLRKDFVERWENIKMERENKAINPV